jgi:hypothetical protein
MTRISPLLSVLLLGTACKDPIVLESYLAIVHISPNDGAVNIPVETAPMATFSEELDEDSITPLDVYLEDGDGVPVEAELAYESTTSTISLVPVESLSSNSTYVLVLGEGIEGLESGTMVQEIQSQFTTSGMGGGDNVNHSPVANAGDDQTVTVNDEVTLDGSLSTDDDDDDDLTYWWEFVQIPDESISELDDPTLVNPIFTADVIGTYIVSLFVDDGTVSSELDYVQIFVEE